MTASTLKLTDREAKGLAALGSVAKKVPRARAVQVAVGKGSAAVAEGEVLVLVLSASGAAVGRTKVTGQPTDIRALRAVLQGADVAAGRLRAADPPPPLAEADAALLDQAGLVEGSGGADPLERSQIELELLLRESLTLEDAARALRVSTGRLRQRLAPGIRTLYGLKLDGRAWRIPRFQFGKKGRLIRNIDKVLPSISPEAHVLSIYGWFTSPHQDLVAGKDERPVTPLSWLEAGLDPDVVAKLAREI